MLRRYRRSDSAANPSQFFPPVDGHYTPRRAATRRAAHVRFNSVVRGLRRVRNT